MDQPISLRILRIILVMTCGYKKKCCNASQIIYRGYVSWYVDCYLLCKYLVDKSTVTCFRQSMRTFSSAQCQKITSFWVIHNYVHSANLDLN